MAIICKEPDISKPSGLDNIPPSLPSVLKSTPQFDIALMEIFPENPEASGKTNHQEFDDLKQFQKEVIEKWGTGSEGQEFKRLYDAGQIQITAIGVKELRTLDTEAKLFFREGELYLGTINGIKLPLKHELVAEQPVNLVRTPDGQGLVIANGNHRVYKILDQKSSDFPLYAVIYDSPEIFRQAMDLPSPFKQQAGGHWGSVGPSLVYGKRKEVA